MFSANGSCPYNCSYKNSLGYCQVTACIHPNHNGSGTYIVESYDYHGYGITYERGKSVQT